MQSRVSQRALRFLWLCSAWLLLDLALFLPGYWCAQPRAAFWPFHFAANTAHAGVDPLTKGASVVAAAGSGWGAQLGVMLWRPNQDVFRVSVDLCLVMVCTLWTARRPRIARFVRVGAVTGYLVLLVFLAYHHGVERYLARVPALGEDWRLALNLFHLIGGWSLRRSVLCAALPLVLAAAAWLMTSALRGLQLRAAGWSPVQCLRWSLLLLVPCVLGLSTWGVRADEPTFQWLGKRVLYNLRASYYEAERLAEARGRPDLTYEAYSRLQLARRPDVYLLMIEAYGEALATSDMVDAYRALMTRAETRLAAVGYHARSAYSAAPVHGGTSWFSISSVHTGIRIDRPSAYDALLLMGARLPTLTRFFREQGYRTYALQPGNSDHKGLRRFDVFNHHEMIDAGRLHYRGPAYGWGVIPDQYSLGVLRDQYWSQARSPRYIFYMAVSTHWAWDRVPDYVRDYRSLNEAAAPIADDAAWPAFPETARIGSEQRRSYFRSVDYEWRLLVEWLESEVARDGVILIVGDHQPLLELDSPLPTTRHTPVHVLSRDAAFVERFADAGLRPGLYAAPGGPVLRHEGLFSLWVSKLMAAYGAPDAPAVQVLPQGIGLAGLSR